MKTFLARTFDTGGFLGERGSARSSTSRRRGRNGTAKMMFLTGTSIEDADRRRSRTPTSRRRRRRRLDKAKAAKTPPPAPKFSAGRSWWRWRSQDENAEFFARSIVNRMWHRFFGCGLVKPLDQMHSENPPSHPELLAWLARDIVAHGYDLKRLIRGIVLSRAYSRSSQYDSRPARTHSCSPSPGSSR